MKSIFTAVSPNVQIDDIFLALKLFLQPWKWRLGAGKKLLREQFIKYFKSEQVWFFDSGRGALLALLKTLDLPEGSEILMQAYTCVAVPEPFLWCGLKPVYVDCDLKSLNMSVEDLKRKITANAKVLVIQHTFGNPADLDELVKIAKQHGLFVIEDCAHALGAEYNGRKVGTFGDASFFSFGRDKVISAVFGGALMVRDSILQNQIQRVYETVPEASLLWVMQQIWHPILMGLAKKSYDFFSLGKILMKFYAVTGILSKAVYPEERHGGKPQFIMRRLPNALALMALHQFEKLDQFNRHRSVVADFYKTHLTAANFRSFPEEKGSQSIWLRYTIRTPFAKKILLDAKKNSLYLGDWYTTPIAPQDVDHKAVGYEFGACPNAEILAKETLNLPTHIGIGQAERLRIVNYLNHYGN